MHLSRRLLAVASQQCLLAPCLDYRSELGESISANALCDEAAHIAAQKTSALETQLTVTEGMLEFAEAELGSLRRVCSNSDAELCGQHSTLVERAKALFARLAVFPLSPVEPSEWGLTEAVAEESEPTGTATPRLRLLAPRGVLPSDVQPCRVPSFVRVGGSEILSFSLDLTPEYLLKAGIVLGEPGNNAAALWSLDAFMRQLRVHARLIPECVDSAPSTRDRSSSVEQCFPSLPVTLTPVINKSSILLRVSIAVPTSALVGDRIAIGPVVVAGSVLGSPFPSSTLVRRGGMHAPLLIPDVAVDYYTTPCISADGHLFVPNKEGSFVATIDADGTRAKDLLREEEGAKALSAAALDEESQTLLATRYGAVALDLTSGVVRWVVRDTSLISGIGIAVIPSWQSDVPHKGALFVCNGKDDSSSCLHLCRVADGSVVTSAPCDSPGPLAYAVDTRQLFVSCDSGARIASWAWDGSRLVDLGERVAMPHEAKLGDYPPLTIMPVYVGAQTPFLIVGECDCDTLRVFSLPLITLVHTHTFPGFEIEGLAADPSGTALAVCDRASGAVHVVPWPLPGHDLCR